MKKYNAKKRGNKTSVSITLSETALAWLEMKGRDDMRPRAGYAAKIFESLSRGMYIDTEGSTKKLKKILKGEKDKGGRRRPLTLALSDKALTWLAREARKDLRPRATFAAKIIEQLARGMYVPVLTRSGRESVGQPIQYEIGVSMIGKGERHSQGGEVSKEFMRRLEGKGINSNKPLPDNRKENRNGKTNRPKN